MVLACVPYLKDEGVGRKSSYAGSGKKNSFIAGRIFRKIRRVQNLVTMAIEKKALFANNISLKKEF